jgi:hypothetical protein
MCALPAHVPAQAETARDLLYEDRVGDLAAHQISTGTLIAAFAGYSRALEQRWPMPTTRPAQTIGGAARRCISAPPKPRFCHSTATTRQPRRSLDRPGS